MFVDIRAVKRWTGIALIAFVLWLIWWCQAERQVRRAQGRLLDAIESRDYQALARLLADNYRDGWEHDKTFVLQQCPRVFDQFIMLDVEGDIHGTEQLPAGWLVRQKIVVKGIGGALGMYARDEVNALKEPFVMTWRKRSWKPWDWELTRIEQPELRIPREF